MGRSDYLVQAGVGFDVDRSGARKSIGIFESLATSLSTVAVKAAADGFTKTQKDYESTMADLKKTDEKANKDLKDGAVASAKATQEALKRSMPKPLSAAQKKKKRKDGELVEYNKDLKRQLGGMKTSYAKYVKEAAKLGIKVTKAQKGFGTGQSVKTFKDKDVEQRKQLINLNKRMIQDEKKRAKQMEDRGVSTKNLHAQIKALEKQERAMVNLNEDLTQQERKAMKIKQKVARDERKAEKTRAVGQKKHIQRLKDISRGLQRMGQLASMTASKIKSGLQNAFVIGTAAAGAFFYKMQPLVESVMEFEKTIVNANSVFNVTQKELHGVSDSMVNFTLKYGVSAQETATGLYQLASAGLTAAESQEVLQHTMKLAMATQGDHNTLAKLTTQTIMGFGMEMSDAEELTDKFAHSIQKSLIEWQDLASSVKFAMPFFVATGQSIDELLGGLEVLTNRALEAGIAGRGLRQALAQFAKHANDNSSAFSKMGISILDAEGNMKALSAIALEAKAAFGDVTDLEALTAMLEDMNVRGATAFALLVQNADEFDTAVKNVANSAGEATLMADIQQESLAMQIQRVKNALLAPFLLSDKIGKEGGSLNEFTLRIKELVDEFTKFFIIIENGQETYSDHGNQIKKFVIEVLNEAVIIIKQLKDVFLEQGTDGFETFTSLLKLATAPMKLMLKILDKLGPNFLKWFTYWKLFTSLMPLTNILTMIQTMVQTKLLLVIATTNAEEKVSIGLDIAGMKTRAMKILSINGETIGLWLKTKAEIASNWAQKQSIATMKVYGLTMLKTMGIISGFVILAVVLESAFGKLGIAVAGMAAGLFLYYQVRNLANASDLYKEPILALTVAMATGAAAAVAIWAGYNSFSSKANAAAGGSAANLPLMAFNKERNYDGGGTFLPTYDNGGMSTEHGMAILQKGETIIPKTQNMLGGGITLNMGDVHVQDGEDFAERVAAALPSALQRVNDSGAI